MGYMYRSGEYVNNCSETYGRIFINDGGSIIDYTNRFSQRMNIYYNTEEDNNKNIIKFGDGLINAVYMFEDCYNFNKPINIPDSINNCYEMFSNCFNFNSPVTIGNNVTDCHRMFFRCNNFNQPVNIPDSAINCSYMFEGCSNFNQPIIISNKHENIYCSSMLSGCSNMSSNIFVNIDNGYFISMLNRRNNSHSINIFCKNSLPFLGTNASDSITSNNMTWTAITNGYKNTLYNIYIYNNLI